MAGLGLSGEVLHLNAPVSTRFVAAKLSALGGWNRVSNGTLGSWLGLSTRTVRRAIRWLEERGHVERRGPNRYRQVRCTLASYRSSDPDRRWIPADVLTAPTTAERRLWISFVHAHSNAAPGDLDADNGYGGMMLSDRAIATRLNVARQTANNCRRWAEAAGVIEETLGDNVERGGFRLAEDWRKRIEDQMHDPSETVSDGKGVSKCDRQASISDPVASISGRVASISGHPTRDSTRRLTRDMTGERRQAAVTRDDDVSDAYKAIFELGPDGIPIECF